MKLYVLYRNVSFPKTLCDPERSLKHPESSNKLHVSSIKPFKTVEVMFDNRFVPLYSIGSIVHGYLRICTLIIHTQVIMS